jgi:anti-sigma factor RsiW
MNCNQTAHIHAYHDGELSPARRDAVERHLAECGECRERLADLRGISQLVAAAPLAAMPGDAMPRLQKAWWAAQDRGVLRIAGWMTAAAAAVLFVAVLWSPAQHGDNGSSNWQLAALTPPTPVVDDEPQDEIVIAADWIANDLSFVGERQ